MCAPGWGDARVRARKTLLFAPHPLSTLSLPRPPHGRRRASAHRLGEGTIPSIPKPP